MWPSALAGRLGPGVRRLILRRTAGQLEIPAAFRRGESDAPSSSAPAGAQRQLLGRKTSTSILVLVGLLPLAAIVRLIGEYGVNVPFGDEWSLVPTFAKWHAHQLTFSDLFRQHNEHRIFFPKLIYLGFAQWTHWNLKAEMFFSVLLACATSAAIYFLLERTVPATARKRLLLWALINLLIFAPVQAENWLWGFQLQIFLPNVCLAACLALLTARAPDAVKLTGALIFAAIATFSFGGGVLLWPVIAFCLILRGASARCLLAWIGTAAIVALFYFSGYKRLPVAGPEFGHRLDHVAYFANFLGIALNRCSLSTHAAVAAALTGAIGFLLYLIACAAVLKLSPTTRASAAPWLAFGAYAIGSAALAAYTRVAGGPPQALNSRYATISLSLYVGLIGLVAIAAHAARAEHGTFVRFAASFERSFFTAVVTLAALSFPAGIDHMQLLRRLRLEGAARLQFCRAIDPSEKLRNRLVIGSDLPAIVQSADLLDRLQLLKPRLRRSTTLRDGEDRPQRSTDEFGRADALVQKDADAYEMHGWCFLPAGAAPAPCVVLAYRADKEWLAIGLVEPSERRPDVVSLMRSKKYLDSGWRAVIHRKALPAGPARVSAWAFDPQLGQTYKLPGDFILPAE